MDTGNYTLFTQFKESIKNDVILAGLIPQIDLIVERFGAEYLEVAEDILVIMQRMGYDSFVVCKQYNFDYLLQMNQFLKTGDYGHTDYEQVKEDIYFNKDVMLNTYMPGLLLAYSNAVFLFEKVHLFINSFVSRLNSGASGIEVGYGEGFYLWQLVKRAAHVNVKGYDISEYSLDFAARMLDMAGVPKDRCELLIGDVTRGLPIEDGSLDFGLIAEVIEHLADPVVGIKELARIIKKGGFMYLTTVIDCNHMDHISNFESPSEVENMITDCGFIIADKIIYRVKDDFPNSHDASISLAFVCERQ